MEQFTCTGRLTKDPKAVNDITYISIAVNKSRKNKQTGEYENKANFYDVSIFGKSAEYALNHFRKGDVVSVIASLEVQNNKVGNSYEKKVYITARSVEKYTKSSGDNGQDYEF